MRYYKRVDGNGKTLTVEAYSHALPVAGAVEIDKTGHDAFIAALPVPKLETPRDLAAELDELKAELIAKGVIRCAT